MKYLLILSIVLLLLSGCRSANQQELSDRNDDQVINSIEERWAQAELERKVDFFEQTLADDYVYTAPDGSYFTKSQVLNKTKKLPEGITGISLNLEDVKARIYGLTAVVTGMAVQKIRIKDKEGIGKYRYTRIYRKQNGGWHAVVMQATIVSTSN